MNNSQSWTNPKITVNESNIDGKAMFAKEKIAPGETLIIQGGKIVERERVDDPEYLKYNYHGFQIKRDFYIYPNVFDDKPFFDGIFLVNHSCEPNCGFSDAITLVSMQEINPGDEITFDYAMTDMELVDEVPWDPMSCKCGSRNCRKTISGFDWKRKDIQKKYKDYFSPYIKKAIKEEA